MTENPDAIASGAPTVGPAASTGSGTSAVRQEAEPVEAPGGPTVGPVSSAGSGTSADAEPVGGSQDARAGRQPVIRVRGARRARLLAAPGTTAEPAPADDPARGTGARPAASGPNDERMMREVPPHY